MRELRIKRNRFELALGYGDLDAFRLGDGSRRGRGSDGRESAESRSRVEEPWRRERRR